MARENSIFRMTEVLNFGIHIRTLSQKCSTMIKKLLKKIQLLNSEQKKLQLLNLESTQKTFNAIMDSKAHDQLKSEGKKETLPQGVQAALFILLYRNEATMLQPFRLLAKPDDS